MDIAAGKYQINQPSQGLGLRVDKINSVDGDQTKLPAMVATKQPSILVDKGETLFIFYPSPADQIFSIVESP
jgi:hypothetical protein